MTNTALAHGHVINVDFRKGKLRPARRSTSLLKSNGQVKATEAQPIRDPEHIKQVQQYFLDSPRKKTGYRNYAIFTIGVIFGIRGGDLLSLRVHHFLRPDGTFKDYCTLYEQKTRKTNNPMITSRVREIVSTLLEQNNYQYNDYLFQSQKHDPITGRREAIGLRQWNDILDKASRDLGITHMSSHTIRKTFGYHIIRLNPNSDDAKLALQKMFNHRDFNTTLTYCGITQETIDKTRNSIENGLAL